MTRLILAIFALAFAAGGALADSITLTPSSQTLPTSTTATIYVDFAVSTSVDNSKLVLSVSSGPDAGQSLTLITGCSIILPAVTCVPGFPVPVFFTNDGTSGTDVIYASFPSGSSATATATITWGNSSTGPVPEPSTILLIGLALTSWVAIRRWIVCV